MDANRIRYDACRLCLCEVDKQLGYSAIADQGFQTMLMHLFRFPVPPLYTFASKTYLLPGLVCSQCSTNVRNFYYFSKQAETNQKVLQSRSLNHNGNSTIVGTDQYIKVEPVLECNVSKASSSDGSTNPRLQTRDEDPLGLFNSANELQVEPIVINSSNCFGKDEVIESLEKMDKRVNAATKQLTLILKTISRPSFLRRRVSFDFTAVSNKEELDALNRNLGEEEYMTKILNWLDPSVTATDCENRMLEALLIIFNEHFLAQCSWAGLVTDKIPIKKYENVLELLKTIGGTRVAIVTDLAVASFLKKRLVHAKGRLKLLNSRKPFCVKRKGSK